MRNRLIILFLIVVGGLAISTVIAAPKRCRTRRCSTRSGPARRWPATNLNPIFEQATNKPFDRTTSREPGVETGRVRRWRYVFRLWRSRLQRRLAFFYPGGTEAFRCE